MTRPTSPDTSMRFITRMPGRLWRVAVAFGTFQPAAVYFSDRHYGGEQAARAAAIAHRDHLVKKHKIPLRAYDGNGWQVARVTSPTNQVGLCLEVRDVHGTTVANWTYLFQKDGRQRRIRLSVRQHGYVTAWQRLGRLRQQRTGQPSNPLPPNPSRQLRQWAQRYDVSLPHADFLDAARQALAGPDKALARQAMAMLRMW